MFQELETLEQLPLQSDMEKLLVDGHPNLYRDKNSGAIINNNSDEYENYIKSYQLRNEQSQRLDKVENDLTEIKFLLTKLMEKL
jgi:hypothetical protein